MAFRTWRLNVTTLSSCTAVRAERVEVTGKAEMVAVLRTREVESVRKPRRVPLLLEWTPHRAKRKDRQHTVKWRSQAKRRSLKSCKQSCLRVVCDMHFSYKHSKNLKI